jgi:hypothetical protein
MTNMELLNEVEVLKFKNSGQQETIVHLRNANLKLYGEIDNLEADLSKTISEFEAFKVGARTFQKLAEGHIIAEAATYADLKIKLLNSLTAKVYGEAKKDNGV